MGNEGSEIGGFLEELSERLKKNDEDPGIIAWQRKTLEEQAREQHETTCCPHCGTLLPRSRFTYSGDKRHCPLCDLDFDSVVAVDDEDRCVECDGKTGYKKKTHIDRRRNYVEGAGQFCEKCYKKYDVT